MGPSTSSNEARLPRRFGDGKPKVARWVNALLLREHERERDVSEGAMKTADHHVGLPRHGRVNRISRELRAEHRIDRPRGHSAKHVARIDVLKRRRDPSLLEVS